MSRSDFLNPEPARLGAHRPLGDLVAALGPEPSLRGGEAARACRWQVFENQERDTAHLHHDVK
jgi:hypothetical protein